MDENKNEEYNEYSGLKIRCRIGSILCILSE